MFANIKILFVLIFATACSSTWEIQDVDGDGKTLLDGDCWDSTGDPVPPKGALNYGITALDIGPEQEDLPYDGIDQNCDGKDDFDQDGDGRVPDVFVGIQTLGLENTGSLEGGDCWDNPIPPSVDSRAKDNEITSDQIFEGASEDLPYDGIDQNCDGKDDFDQDNDGYVPQEYVDIGTQIELIDIEENAVRVTMTEGSGELPSGDCFDIIPDSGVPTEFLPLGDFSEISPEEVYPNNQDPVYDGIDQNCDGDEFEFDADKDGQDSLHFPNREGEVGTDCIDRIEDETAEGILDAAGIIPADVYLDAETDPPYDNIDQNCSGDSDFDADGDGHDSSTVAKYDGSLGDDCNDENSEISPSAQDLPLDGVDQNCDNLESCYIDSDDDGYGSQEANYIASESLDCSGDGVSDKSTDCDDSDPQTFPGAAELDAPNACMKDSDDDGYGDMYATGLNLQQGTDCDDSRNDVNLTAGEYPGDDLDQNCDNFELCYEDFDEDTYGSTNIIPIALTGSLSCDDYEQKSSVNIDCDDGSAFHNSNWEDLTEEEQQTITDIAYLTHPDIAIYETDSTICYRDIDGDGYGDILAVDTVTAGTDCEDDQEDIYPTAPEKCDGQRNDCLTDVPSNEIDDDGDGYVECTIDGGGWDGVSITGGDDCDDDPTTGVLTHPDIAIFEADPTICYRDNDEDGYGDVGDIDGVPMGTDCDDGLTHGPTRYPGAEELCDGLDNDCDENLLLVENDDDGDDYVECTIDGGGWDGVSITGGDDCDDDPTTGFFTRPDVATNETDPTICYRDNDEDGFGDITATGDISAGTDCDDGLTHGPTRYPGAEELCDGLDNDCDGSVLLVENDDDNDKYVECTIDAGGWDNIDMKKGDDCDDDPTTGPLTHPDKAVNELDPTICYRDNDEDGFGDITANGDISAGTDCDDGDNSIYPAASEICDGQINTCGGSLPVDEIDNDSDGYVECTIDIDGWDGVSITGGDDCDDDPTTGFFTRPDIATNETDPTICYRDNDEDGFGDVTDIGDVSVGTDCNDGDDTIYPSAPEICDGQVNTCGGSLPSDEIDDDSDGYVECVEHSEGWDGVSITGFDDCNDEDNTIYPTAPEICDGLINTCGGSLPTNEIDDDGDNFVECSFHVDGWDGVSSVTGDNDCDDDDDTIYPSAPEICDGQVNTCGGSLPTNEIDDDGDNFVECVFHSEGWDGNSNITAGNDCDDGDDTIYPSAPEICDGQVNTCGGSLPTNEIDDDSDGYVECVEHSEGWDGVSITGFADCNDDDDTIYPTAPEICDGQVNTCGGSLPTNEIDNDGDNFVECVFHSDGWDGNSNITAGNDCDDGDDTIYPSAPEICDGQVNTCGGSLPSDETDDDSDGYVECVEHSEGWDGVSITGFADCNDDDDTIYPTASEICDGQVNMCGGSLPSDETDDDSDGYVECVEHSEGWDGVSITGFADCNDDDDTIYPTALEICDGQVNTCGGSLPTNEIDNDGDDYVECSIDDDGWDGISNVVGGDDCDDSSIAKFPGSAENDSTTDCLTDGDNDGYAPVSEGGTDCDDSDSTEDPTVTWYADADGDTYGNPSSSNECERANGTDVVDNNDCDDTDSGEKPGITWYADADGDTYGNPSSSNECERANGTDVLNDDDCDDSDATEKPGVTRYADSDGDTYGNPSSSNVCVRANGTDVLDNTDCDDSDATEKPGVTWYADSDGDTYGNPSSSNVCERANGTDVLDNTDCDDSDAAEKPGVTWYADSDGDTYGNPSSSNVCIRANGTDVLDNTDCDDSDAAEKPGVTWYADSDGDTYGNPSSSNECARANGTDVLDNTDCDDTSIAKFPGSAENDSTTDCLTDGDNDGYAPTSEGGTDCDDSDATEKPGVTWYADSDGDTYGNPSSSNECDRASGTDVLDNTDCDDSDAAEKPGVTWYADSDGDTYGNPSSSNECVRANGTDVLDNTDCDDGDAAEKPGVTWYADSDGDTYGNPSSSNICERGDVTDILNNDDCDDGDDTIYPNAPELCDGLVNNCGGSLPANESDVDEDGYVECAEDGGGWDGTAVTGYEDCDDSDENEYPTVTWYADSDGDGFGNASSSNVCDRANGTDVLDSTDCDDSNTAKFPGSAENDSTTECWTDVDGDGYAPTSEGGTDCDDSDVGSTNQSEDSDCDGIPDDCFLTNCDMSVDLGNGFGIDFVLINELDDPSGRYSLSNNFYMMTTEVTQGMFEEVMGYDSRDGESTSYGDGDNYPAYYVNWHMAAHFANTLSADEGEQACYSCTGSGTSVTCSEAMDPYLCTGYSLPTEHEWELAARSGTTSEFWTGEGVNLGGTYSANDCNTSVTIQDGVSNPPLSDYAWFCGNSNNRTTQVGTKLPNGFGLYDMHGNIREWTSDWYGCTYPNSGTWCNLGSERVRRGGYWPHYPDDLRSSNRSLNHPVPRNGSDGFRLRKLVTTD